jgi:hypothetical protein
MKRTLWALLPMAFLMPISAAADSAPSRQALAAFRLAEPCPANGLTRGTCPGYVIDHVVALVCGGPDEASNMQWQTTAEAKAKDRWERIGCRPGRRPPTPSIPSVVVVYPLHLEEVTPIPIE